AGEGGAKRRMRTRAKRAALALPGNIKSTLRCARAPSSALRAPSPVKREKGASSSRPGCGPEAAPPAKRERGLCPVQSWIGSGRLGHRLIDRRMRGGQGVATVLRRHGQAFGADELDLCNAHEPEDELQVRLLEIARRTRVQPAAGAGDDHPLATGQALGAVGGVAEGPA